MKILATFFIGDNEPSDYKDRPTVKAIIVNDNDEVLFFASGIPGGGVEVGETNEEALNRELMEELGAQVSIDEELGSIVAYRDVLKLKYIFTFYKCTLISIGTPTTTIGHEIGKTFSWEKRSDAINRIEKFILDVKEKGQTFYEGDRYQRYLFNAQAALLFLNKIS